MRVNRLERVELGSGGVRVLPSSGSERLCIPRLASLRFWPARGSEERFYDTPYPSEIFAIGALRTRAFQGIGYQEAHSPVNGETQRDFAVLFAKIRSTACKAGLVNRLVELSLKYYCRAAHVQTDRIRLVARAHQPVPPLDYIAD